MRLNRSAARCAPAGGSAIPLRPAGPRRPGATAQRPRQDAAPSRDRSGTSAGDQTAPGRCSANPAAVSSTRRVVRMNRRRTPRPTLELPDRPRQRRPRQCKALRRPARSAAPRQPPRNTAAAATRPQDPLSRIHRTAVTTPRTGSPPDRNAACSASSSAISLFWRILWKGVSHERPVEGRGAAMTRRTRLASLAVAVLAVAVAVAPSMIAAQTSAVRPSTRCARVAHSSRVGRRAGRDAPADRAGEHAAGAVHAAGSCN